MDDRSLTIQICELLGAIDGWIWDPDPDAPAYPADMAGVFYGAIDATPDRAVGVRVYASGDERDGPAWRRVQLRLRGGKRERDGADVLASRAFDALDDLSRVGGISGISRISMSPLGADKNGREERTENYLIILDNPEASES